MSVLKDDVQILRVREQSNTSQITVALGRRLGQLHVMAKGSRRFAKNGFEGGFDLLARGQILAYPRPNEQLWVFKEWDEQARPAIGQSYRMLAAGSYLCELVEALTRHTAGAVFEGDEAGLDSFSKLYDLLAAAADALSTGTANFGALLLSFTLKALEIEALLSPLTTCHVCEKPFIHDGRSAQPVWLSSQGLECKACVGVRRNLGRHAAQTEWTQRGVWLSPEARQSLLHFQRSPRPLKLSAMTAEQLGQGLMIWVHGALERDLRTLPYALKMVQAMR